MSSVKLKYELTVVLSELDDPSDEEGANSIVEVQVGEAFEGYGVSFDSFELACVSVEEVEAE